MSKIKKPSFDFSLQPKDSIDYLKNKGYKLTFDYDEMLHDAHNKAFTVAKVTRLDLLSDIHSSIVQAMQKGETFENWKKNITPTLKEKGWIGEQEIVSPKTGEVKTIHVDGHRLRNIFKTNTRVSRSIGRYKQMKSGKFTEYWKYIGGLSENPRNGHLAKNGMILHRDDPWWNTNYPPNGWGCKCRVRAYSKKQIEKRLWSGNISSSGGKNIASDDWAYDIGAGSRVSALSKLQLDNSLDSLPKAKKNSNYESLSQAELLHTFYKKMGVKKGEMFIDKVGDPMIIDDNLFTSHTGHLKIAKRDRHLLLDEMIPTIKEPDEIYLEFEVGKITGEKRLLKKMLRYITVDGKKRAVIAIFEYLKDKTQGVSLHLVESANAVENKRVDKLIYKRESD